MTIFIAGFNAGIEIDPGSGVAAVFFPIKENESKKAEEVEE